MFSYVNCYDKIVNDTFTPEKVCYTCDSFCEFSILVFLSVLITCCISTCYYPKKKRYKEIIIEPQSPPPYS